MNVDDKPTRWAGYRSLKFHHEIHEVYRWDIAWNVDNLIKAADRPNVPRVIPVIRLDVNGYPVYTRHPVTGREQERVLAAIYIPNQSMMVVAVYDPTYKDPNYRYRLQQHDTDSYGITQRLKNNYGRQDLQDLMEAFATWTPAPVGMREITNPLRYVVPTRHRPKADIPIPHVYVQAGYGNWA